MPLEVGIYFEGEEKPQIEIIRINEKSNIFTINVDMKPKNVVLDPNTWVLMDAEFRRNKQYYGPMKKGIRTLKFNS